MSSSTNPEKNPTPILPYARQWIDEADIEAVSQVLRSDFLTQGPAVERFEQALCAATGARHAVAVASGTAALHLTCIALDFGPGQTGITSPITFAASANCFLYAGGGVAFADVDPATGLMRADALDARIRELASRGVRPGVVIAVSLAGKVAPLPELADVCARHGWVLLEDAAHSLGATYGVPATGAMHRSGGCAHTRAAILSFHPVKHVCAGEGGAVVTNDEVLAQRVRRLRTHGIEKPTAAEMPADEGGWFYEQRELGFHYRITDIQAALGASQLARLPAFLGRRREIARGYAEVLGRAPFDRVLRAPAFEPDHAYHLYVVHFRTRKLRRSAYDFLAARGIRTQVHYIPVHRHPHYRRVCGEISLPGADTWYGGCLSLPLFPKMTEADQQRVVEELREFASVHG